MWTMHSLQKTEPKPIVGNFNMASVTNGPNSGISKKSLYKPVPKERIKAKHTNRKPLAQSQLVDLNNSRSAKICKNGMKSLLTLEHNFLSPDVLFLVDNMMLKLMTNWVKLWMRKRIGIKRIQLQKLFAMHDVLQRRNCLEKVQVQLAKKSSRNCFGYRNKIQFFFLQQRCKYKLAKRYECHTASFWFQWQSKRFK